MRPTYTDWNAEFKNFIKNKFEGEHRGKVSCPVQYILTIQTSTAVDAHSFFLRLVMRKK